MTKARTLADNFAADINGITAGTGISGGGTSGTVTVTNSMATAIDAKGDLVVGTGADTFDRLVAGSNGDTIVADSSTTTGLRYTAGTVQSNPVLNSAMQVWQRGTSFTTNSTGYYAADRWCVNTNTTGRTVSRQVTNDTTNLPNIQYAMRIARDSGNSATTSVLLTQSMETVNSIPFAGKTVTFSFYARAGANYSATSNRLGIYLITGTGTDQNRSAAVYTGEAYAVNNATATLTTTWQRFTFTGNVGATATEIAAYFDFSPTGTAGAADYFEVTGVQIDIGSVALPFRTYAGTIQGELAACQRYYYRATASGSNRYLGNIGSAISTTSVRMPWVVPVVMRDLISIDFSGIGLDDGVNATVAVTSASFIYANAGLNVVGLNLGVASGLTQFRSYSIFGATSGNYIGVSGEL